MDETKSWYMSKSVWGGLVAVAAAGLAAFGYTVGADEQSALTDIVVAVAGGIGGLIAIVGRVKATKQVK